MSKENKENKQYKKTSIGGQALIEGVMMRGPAKTAIAVRNKSGRICVEEWDNVVRKSAWFKIPFVRGIFNFIDSMKVGYKALMRSAEISEMVDDEESEEDIITENEALMDNEAVKDNKEIDETSNDNNEVEQETTDDKLKEAETSNDDKTLKDEKVSNDKNKSSKEDKKDDDSVLIAIAMTIGSLLGTVLAVVLFVGLPTWLCNFLKKYVDALNSRYVQSAVEGILKIIIFLAYISVVSLWEDMRRVFMYHGAEHKTIFCYEHGLDLNVENVKIQGRFHPRCGTSFIIFMLIIGIFISMFIPNTIPTVLRTAIKLLCLPLIMGIGYEAIKLAGRKDNLFVRILSAPGLWVQRISTKEPDDFMIECAITSFLAVVPKEDDVDDSNKVDTENTDK